MAELTTIIVARKGSKRIPCKMHSKIGNETLLTRKIRQCLPLGRVIVGTNDDDIKDEVKGLGAYFIRRPDEFCDEQSRTPNEMIKNMLWYLPNLEQDLILWAHPTNPFIDTDVYRQALEFYKFSIESGHDSVFSVNKLVGHYWTDRQTPINYNPMSPIHAVAAALPPVYEQNGGIFIRRHEEMRKDGCFIGQKPAMFVMDKYTGWDIDYPRDLEIAQRMAEDEKA